MGTHLSRPSLLKESGVPLSEVLSDNPKLVGDAVSKKYGADQLPFLFKILSINKALSIQAHPDKSLAKKLHERDPTNYKGIGLPRMD